MRLKITPSAVAGRVSVPPSKSYTHRALILGSLAEGETIIENPLTSDDTLYTIDACRSLGIDIASDGKTVKIKGAGGEFSLKPGEKTIFVGNSGSTIRMVAPLAALAKGRVVFDGEPRLRERPIGDLLSGLMSMGVKASAVNGDDCPPIEIIGGRLVGAKIKVSGMASSQHISSLLMIAPHAEGGLKVEITDRLRSRPYVDITIDIMRRFGVEVENRAYKEFVVGDSRKYTGKRYRVEGDYSAAAYYFAAAAVGRCEISVGELDPASAQGDRYFLDILSQMGCVVRHENGMTKVVRSNGLRGIDVDMGDYPDIVQILAVVAAYAGGVTRITNIGHLRYKETDRINNTAIELGKMGIKTEVTEDTMLIIGGRPEGAVIEAYSDHRMAMSFAIAALFADGDTVINGSEAVSKSYPDFFADLAGIGAWVQEV